MFTPGRFSPGKKKFMGPLGVAHSTRLQGGYGITRSYSNFSNKQPYNQDNIPNFKGVKVYDSMKEDRVNILKEPRDKSGVYCLINKVNGHAYVGSSINLASSFSSLKTCLSPLRVCILSNRLFVDPP